MKDFEPLMQCNQGRVCAENIIPIRSLKPKNDIPRIQIGVSSFRREENRWVPEADGVTPSEAKIASKWNATLAVLDLLLK